ncbi:MAG: hypothetical protein GXZ08_05690 [Tissierellia bacterium]|nr:hypothetical protein [Tissierellia bacterium]
MKKKYLVLGILLVFVIYTLFLTPVSLNPDNYFSVEIANGSNGDRILINDTNEVNKIIDAFNKSIHKGIKGVKPVTMGYSYIVNFQGRMRQNKYVLYAADSGAWKDSFGLISFRYDIDIDFYKLLDSLFQQ